MSVVYRHKLNILNISQAVIDNVARICHCRQTLRIFKMILKSTSMKTVTNSTPKSD